MKKKIFTFMFGLLLAVGWTSSAFAQEATYKAADVQNWTYTWTDANNEPHTSAFTDVATDPYQMYELLRQIYMDKRFPGPTHTAYTNNNVRERKVYYGGIDGGWDINGGVTTTYGNITINVTNQTSTSWIIFTEYHYVYIKSIKILSAGNEIFTWTAGGSTPSGMTIGTGGQTSNGELYFNERENGTITLNSSLLQNVNSQNVQVVIEARSGDSGYAGTIAVNNANSTTITVANNPSSYNWTVAGTATKDENYYTPNADGYTALVVAVNNNTVTSPYDYYNGYDDVNAISTFNTKAEIIQYFTDNVAFVKLLTDGLRIGSNDDYSRGTVFNCDGTYNKFFFLSKGQSRQKDSEVIELQETWGLMGEDVPFKEMFEEFSPTSGEGGSEITDFYIEMMDGKVYNVVHDCASVIHAHHQFSMSGNSGTQEYAMSGMNFFIPDYRLKYWTTTYSGNTVDGRTMNPYKSTAGTTFRNVPSYCANYAQYNQLYAPKVGIYTIHLDAEAEPTATEHVYKVNLDWTSSLNEMSGNVVDQQYVVYVVLTDSVGNQKLDTLTVTGATHYDYNVPQNEHSYTITYQVMGSPTDSDHPAFIAWSNMDYVVIPGWNDFLSLALEHYESDFDVPIETNWYRNFLAIDNENEDNALSTTRIAGGESEYTLWRYDFNKPEPKTKVATLDFEVKNGGKTVDYTVDYENQQIEPIPSTANSQYERSAMGVEDEGTLSVKGNGDIIIQPSGYDVNLYSITVTAGNTTLTWNANQTIESRGWQVTNGSFMAKDPGTNYYYLEGGGYIRIPYTLIGNSTNVNVTINASRDAGKTAWIAVNEDRKMMTNTAATNYTWNNVNPASPSKAPNRVPQAYTSSLVFNARCNGSGTADDGTVWTVTSDASESNFSNSNGIHYGTQNASVSYLRLTTSGIPGTITKIVVNASRGSNNAYLDVKVGGNAFDTQARALTTTATEYTFEGSATGNIVVELYKTNHNSTRQALYCKSIVVTYELEDGTVAEGMVRLGNLPIIDQFNVQIPATNDHPTRYAYVLKYESPDTIILSSVAEVPVQHTGANIEGFYTIDEMDNDTDPENFLKEDLISAEVDMQLSPTSAPYYYTINSVLDNIPEHASDSTTFVSKLQRRTAGDYQEMQSRSGGVDNPNLGVVYPAGEYEFLDYRAVVAESTEDYMTYVPIIWTTGIERRYYVDDSLHNSYGAPIWEVKRGDVNIDATVQKQTSSSGGWNPSVNWYVKNDAGTDSTAYGLYFVGFTATGILPESNIEYEPYMFRVWLVDSTQSLRNYTWEYNAQGKPLKIVDAGARPGIWFPLAEKQCNGAQDLVFQVDITNDYANNLQFAGPLNNFKPDVVARFYYKVIDHTAPAPQPNTLRAGHDENDHVGYVVVKGVKPDPSTAIHEIKIVGEIVSQTYYNVQGLESDRPFDGVNIVVTRFSDGSVTTTKVVK